MLESWPLHMRRCRCPDGVDNLDEWGISLAEELSEDPSAQKTFDDTLYYHIGFHCFSPSKSMFRLMRKTSVTVKELKAWLLSFFLAMVMNGGGWFGASVARGRVSSIVVYALWSRWEQKKGPGP